MIRHIEFIEVKDICDGKIVDSQPFLVKLEEIESLSQSTKYPGCCNLKVNGQGAVIAGEYKDLKAKIDYVRESAPPRLCYSFTDCSTVGCTYSHYVPVDAVSSIMINKGDNAVTLVLKTGDKLNTHMTMQGLKKTLIEVNF